MRIFSGQRLSPGNQYTDLFWNWLLYPGFPQVRVGWSQSGDSLLMFAEQFQPGVGFPLIPERVRMTFLDGSTAAVPLEGGSGRLDLYSAVIPPGSGTVVSIDMNPAGVLPADFTYERMR